VTTIGIVHPGTMGAAMGATLATSDHHVAWASTHRGAATRARAELAGIETVITELTR